MQALSPVARKMPSFAPNTGLGLQNAGQGKAGAHDSQNANAEKSDVNYRTLANKSARLSGEIGLMLMDRPVDGRVLDVQTKLVMINSKVLGADLKEAAKDIDGLQKQIEKIKLDKAVRAYAKRMAEKPLLDRIN